MTLVGQLCSFCMSSPQKPRQILKIEVYWKIILLYPGNYTAEVQKFSQLTSLLYLTSGGWEIQRLRLLRLRKSRKSIGLVRGWWQRWGNCRNGGCVHISEGISRYFYIPEICEEKQFWSILLSILMFAGLICRSSCCSSCSLICGQACPTVGWKPIHYCNSAWSSLYRSLICKRNKALASKFGQFIATLHQSFLGISIISYTTCYQLGHTVVATFEFFGHFY